MHSLPKSVASAAGQGLPNDSFAGSIAKDIRLSTERYSVTLGKAASSFVPARRRAVLLQVSYRRYGGKVSRSIAISRSEERRRCNGSRHGFLRINAGVKEKRTRRRSSAIEHTGWSQAFGHCSSIIDQPIIESLESECSIHRTLRMTPRTPRGTTSKPVPISGNIVLTIVFPPASREL